MTQGAGEGAGVWSCAAFFRRVAPDGLDICASVATHDASRRLLLTLGMAMPLLSSYNARYTVRPKPGQPAPSQKARRASSGLQHTDVVYGDAWDLRPIG
jgi:hypothetical protein